MTHVKLSGPAFSFLQAPGPYAWSHPHPHRSRRHSWGSPRAPNPRQLSCSRGPTSQSHTPVPRTHSLNLCPNLRSNLQLTTNQGSPDCLRNRLCFTWQSFLSVVQLISCKKLRFAQFILLHSLLCSLQLQQDFLVLLNICGTGV